MIYEESGAISKKKTFLKPPYQQPQNNSLLNDVTNSCRKTNEKKK